MPVIYLNYKYITICTAITICKPNFAKIWADISNQNISTLICYNRPRCRQRNCIRLALLILQQVFYTYIGRAIYAGTINALFRIMCFSTKKYIFYTIWTKFLYQFTQIIRHSHSPKVSIYIRRNKMSEYSIGKILSRFDQSIKVSIGKGVKHSRSSLYGIYQMMKSISPVISGSTKRTS